MRKIGIALLLFSLLTVFLSSPINASKGLIKPSSKFYFLQTWGEQIRLLFTSSSDQKLNYLLELTERRVDELTDNPSPSVSNHYENHYQKLNQLTSKIQNKHQATERIRERSLAQQQVLAAVYNQVSEPAKAAIIKAQESSSKQVTKTIEAVEGAQPAQEYMERVAQIQQTERVGQNEQLEPAPMENNPNSNPSQNTPREAKDTNPLKQGQPLNPLNSGQDTQTDDGTNRLEPAQPIQMNQPAGQN